MLALAGNAQQSTTGGAKVAINVSPLASSPTYGIQEALNSIPAGGPGVGTNVTGALIQLAAGDYYLTNNLYFTNGFVTSFRMVGASALGTRLIYAGNTTTNVFTIIGGTANGLGHMHVELEDFTLMSITNGQMRLLVVTNDSYFSSTRVNYTGWEPTTNNNSGPGLSIVDVPTQAPGLVGAMVGSVNEHQCVFKECFFAGLTTCIDCMADHITIEDMKTAVIGQSGAAVDSSAWPNTSPYSIGACVLFGHGLATAPIDAHLVRPHFYSVNSGIAFLKTSGGVFVDEPVFETCDHPFIALVPSATTFTVSELSIAEGATRYALTNTGIFGLVTTNNMDVRYALSSTFLPSIGSVNANTANITNISTLSAALTTIPTNLMAAGFNPDFSKSFETAATNTGPVIFGLPKNLPAADYAEHLVSIENSGASLQSVTATTGYITNMARTVMKVTNQSLVRIQYRAGKYTNFIVEPNN